MVSVLFCSPNQILLTVYTTFLFGLKIINTRSFVYLFSLLTNSTHIFLLSLYTLVFINYRYVSLQGLIYTDCFIDFNDELFNWESL
ncbi:Uncharacterised protein [Chlamydia trachomatis]|nr:Uncharacterised protein [Chlamydia trachomatis]